LSLLFKKVARAKIIHKGSWYVFTFIQTIVGVLQKDL
jgi:hypothetical protein